ncbi:MAG: radical SAM protein [Candidatus Helarchaeota archaeon]
MTLKILEENEFLKKKKTYKITRGTREWSDYSINCITGCSNNCRYCYARKMAIRFGRKSDDNWKYMEIREKDVKKKYKLRKGRFMFPTAHDITKDPDVLEACLIVLNNLLKVGNSVLITTKPSPFVIKKICSIFEPYKNQIQFRFTITSNQDNLLQFWEPGAPPYNDRIYALKYAFKKGFKTSVSIEPFLNDPSEFIFELTPYITESIWIGPMNYIKRNNLKYEEIEPYDQIRKLNLLENLLTIYKKVNKIDKVRIKDAFINKLTRITII